jgi:hypothetical protein
MDNASDANDTCINFLLTIVAAYVFLYTQICPGLPGVAPMWVYMIDLLARMYQLAQSAPGNLLPRPKHGV